MVGYPLSLPVKLSSVLDSFCDSSSFLGPLLPVELSPLLDLFYNSSSLLGSLFLVAVKVEAINPVSLSGKFPGIGACFLGLVVFFAYWR